MRGGDVKKVGDLFAKYRNTLVAPESSVVEAFVEVVEDIFGIKLSKKNLRYQPGSKTLFITGNAALKSEIKTREIEVLNHLKGRLGPKNAPKVIL